MLIYKLLGTFLFPEKQKFSNICLNTLLNSMNIMSRWAWWQRNTYTVWKEIGNIVELNWINRSILCHLYLFNIYLSLCCSYYNIRFNGYNCKGWSINNVYFKTYPPKGISFSNLKYDSMSVLTGCVCCLNITYNI